MSHRRACAFIGDDDRRLGCWGPTPREDFDPATSAVQLASNDSLTCGVDARGMVRCSSGSSWDGQRAELQLEAPPGPAVQVAVLYGSVIARLASGEVFETYEAADPSRDDAAPTWVPVPGIHNAVLVTPGCALESTGRVMCWEDYEASWVGISNAVGLASLDAKHLCVARAGNRPVVCRKDAEPWRPVEGTQGAVEITMDATSDLTICARWADGRVRCGAPLEGEPMQAVGQLTDAIAIDANVNMACAARRSGPPVCWGSNTDFRFGNAPTGECITTPHRVEGLPPAQDISVGTGPTCIVGREGEGYCWGPAQGLGLGGVGERVPPTRIHHDPVEQLIATDGYCQRRRNRSDVECWQGDGFVPWRLAEVFDLPPRSEFDADQWRGCASTPTGLQCSFFGTIGAKEVRPGQWERPPTETSIHGPMLHALALEYSAWGLSSNRVSRVCGLDPQGAVRCADLSESKPTLRRVVGLPPAVSMDVGSREVCAVDRHGALFCQHNDGTTIRRATDVQSVALGWEHGCLLTREGTVSCWGDDACSLSGSSTDRVPQSKPRPVPGLTHVTALDVGHETNCAIDSSGDAWCWGANHGARAGSWSPRSSSDAVPVHPKRIHFFDE